MRWPLTYSGCPVTPSAPACLTGPSSKWAQLWGPHGQRSVIVLCLSDSVVQGSRDSRESLPSSNCSLFLICARRHGWIGDLTLPSPWTSQSWRGPGHNGHTQITDGQGPGSWRSQDKPARRRRTSNGGECQAAVYLNTGDLWRLSPTTKLACDTTHRKEVLSTSVAGMVFLAYLTLLCHFYTSSLQSIKSDMTGTQVTWLCLVSTQWCTSFFDRLLQAKWCSVKWVKVILSWLNLSHSLPQETVTTLPSQPY